MSTFIVLAGGDGPRPWPVLPSPATVIAADSGLSLAAGLGLEPDLIIGDMDSIDLELLAAAEAAGAAVERHPEDKDATDLELALDAAGERRATAITVVGGGGGRLDHLFANASLLAHDRYRDIAIDWFVDDYRVAVVRTTHNLTGTTGDLVTLLATGGTATVTTTGLRWPLTNDELEPGLTRGVSNELAADSATISVESGVVVVLHQRSS